MKKLIAIILGISMAALVGGVSLAGEKDDSKTDDDTPAPQKNFDSAKSNTSTEVATDGDGGDEGDSREKKKDDDG